MIKVLTEEPVAYDTKIAIDDEDFEDYWIYKNPTLYEVHEIFKIVSMVRILLLGNNYYVGSARYYTHGDISKHIYEITKTPYRNYDGYLVIDKEDNIIYSMGMSDGDFLNLKKVLPQMLETKLLNLDVIVSATSSTDMVVKYGINNINDLLNSEL